jgi:hypothetical protein
MSMPQYVRHILLSIAHLLHESGAAILASRDYLIRDGHTVRLIP